MGGVGRRSKAEDGKRGNDRTIDPAGLFVGIR